MGDRKKDTPRRLLLAFPFIIFFLVATAIVSAEDISNDLFVDIWVTNSTGGVETGTYDLQFNISRDATCTDIVHTETATKTTDDRGRIPYYLEDLTLDFDEQYWLCFYRNGTLKSNASMARSPYTFRADNVSAAAIQDDANIDISSYNITASNGFMSIDWLYLQNVPNHYNASTISGEYLYDSSNVLYFNETYLNDTIDDRAVGGAGDITEVNTNGNYLLGGDTSGAVSLTVNETYLNLTIADIDTDTYNTTSEMQAACLLLTLSQFTDNLGDRGYTHLSNFTDDISAAGSGKSTSGNYLYNTSDTIYFNETYLNATIADIDTDTNTHNTTAEMAEAVVATYPNLDTDSTDDFDGAWSSLTGVPAGFSDDVDNDTTYSHLSNFTDDLGDRGYTHLSNFTDDTGSSNPFDQNLNTTDQAVFDAVNVTTGIHFTTDGETLIHTVEGLYFDNNYTGAIRYASLPDNPGQIGHVFCAENPSGVCLPRFAIQRGGADLSSFISRSFAVIGDDVGWLNGTNSNGAPTNMSGYLAYVGEEQKIDFNTATTGADMYIGDDLQIAGDVWIKDKEGEYHFMTRELSNLDSMATNMIFGKYNYTVNGTHFTITHATGEDIEIDISGQNTYKTVSTETVSITNGSNSTPAKNFIYYQTAANPTLTVAAAAGAASNTVHISTIIQGDPENYYIWDKSAYTDNQILNKLLQWRQVDGATYESGFDATASANNISFATGSFWYSLFKVTTTNIVDVVNDGVYGIESDGTYFYGNDFSVFDEYSDTGTAIPSNAYVNLICGVVRNAETEVRMMCIVQNEPDSTYTNLASAEEDGEGTITYITSDATVNKHFLPLVRVILKNSDDTLQAFASGAYFKSVVGVASAGAAAGGTNDHGNLDGLADDDHTQYVLDSDWTDIDDYPAACGAGDYVSAIGDTLTCSTPTDTNTHNTSQEMRDAVNISATYQFSTTGNAATATALAANGANCNAGEYPLGVDASGAVESCTDATTEITAYAQPLEATLTDIADGTITEDLVNTANPWADNEVSDTLTCSILTDDNTYALVAGETFTGEVDFDMNINVTGNITTNQISRICNGATCWITYVDGSGNLITEAE